MTLVSKEEESTFESPTAEVSQTVLQPKAEQIGAPEQSPRSDQQGYVNMYF